MGAQVAEILIDLSPAGQGQAAGGEFYSVVATGLLVEVLAGTTRYAVVTAPRVR